MTRPSPKIATWSTGPTVEVGSRSTTTVVTIMIARAAAATAIRRSRGTALTVAEFVG